MANVYLLYNFLSYFARFGDYQNHLQFSNFSIGREKKNQRRRVFSPIFHWNGKTVVNQFQYYFEREDSNIHVLIDYYALNHDAAKVEEGTCQDLSSSEGEPVVLSDVICLLT